MSVKHVLTLRERKAILLVSKVGTQTTNKFALILRKTLEILHHEEEDEVENCFHTTNKCSHTTKKSDNTPP